MEKDEIYKKITIQVIMPLRDNSSNIFHEKYYKKEFSNNGETLVLLVKNENYNNRLNSK